MPLSINGSGSITGDSVNLITNTGNLNFVSNSGNTALILDNTRITYPTRLSFHVQGFGSISHNSNVTFGSTIFNYGNMINTSTGIVTIPVTGIYVFGYTAIGNNTSAVYYWRFKKNGVVMGNDANLVFRQDTSASGGEYGLNAVFSFIWPFNQGDILNIFYVVSDSSTTPYGNNSANDDYPRFWGCLLT